MNHINSGILKHETPYFAFHVDTPEAHNSPYAHAYVVDMWDKTEESLREIQKKMEERGQLDLGLVGFGVSACIHKFRILTPTRYDDTFNDIKEPLLLLSNYMQKHKHNLEYYLDVLHALMNVYSFKNIEGAIAEVADLEYSLPDNPEDAAREFLRIQSPRLSKEPDFQAFLNAISGFRWDVFLDGLEASGYRTHCSDNYTHVFKNK